MVKHHRCCNFLLALMLVIEDISASPMSQNLTNRSSYQLVNLRVGAWPTGSVIEIQSGDTPLTIAAKFNATKITRRLLEAGALVDKANLDSETPLHIAARSGDAETMEVLLEFGANSQARDNCLKTPAMITAEQGNLKALLMLSTNGVDHDEVDVFGESILHHAARSGTMEELFHLISSANGDLVGQENKVGDSALSLAFRYAGEELPMLLNTAPGQGAYYGEKSNTLSGALLNQSMTGLVMKMVLRRVPHDILSKLLAHQDWYFGTPLYAACTIATIASQIAIIDALLDAGAALELKGGDEGTPLMGACAAGRMKVVKHLVRKGARICYIEDGQVFSALRAAKHFPDIVRWLLVGRYLDGPKLLTI